MTDNYELSRDRAQAYFLGFSQQKLIEQWALDWDESYLYTKLFGVCYRICRKTGKVTDENGAQADYCQSLTIFDLLCHSDGRITPSGSFAAVNSLKGAPMSGGVTPSKHQKLAAKIEENPGKFREICEKMGAKSVKLADICYQFTVFDRLQVLLKFYHGDEEFPPTVTLLWDENTLEHMYYETVFYAAACLMKMLGDALCPEA